jgi:hypothetical protein
MRPELIGIASGVGILLLGKLVDFVLSRRREELSQARLLGELRAGFAGITGRLALVETRLAALEERLDDHAEQAHLIHVTGR